MNQIKNNPSRWKQGVLIFSLIFPLSIVNPWLIHFIFSKVPLFNVYFIQHMLSTILTVTLMTYSLPFLMRRAKEWLYR